MRCAATDASPAQHASLSAAPAPAPAAGQRGAASSGPKRWAMPTRSGVRGFTLVEILAVVALIALAATVISVSVGSGLSGARVKAASRDLVAALRYTRGQAIVKREQMALRIDVDQRRYQAPGRRWVELPDDMTMKLFTARSELEEEGIGRIRFFPDGSSTGGHIDLLRGEALWRIEVMWLTGEARLREGADAP